jgi:hypothetical protein
MNIPLEVCLSSVQTVVPCPPDDLTSAASNFHIEASRIQIGRMVIQMADQMHAISISDARVSRPW